jgi:hypothetical protein
MRLPTARAYERQESATDLPHVNATHHTTTGCDAKPQPTATGVAARAPSLAPLRYLFHPHRGEWRQPTKL